MTAEMPEKHREAIEAWLLMQPEMYGPPKDAAE